MATKNKGYLILHEEIELTLLGLTVRAYTKTGKLNVPRERFRRREDGYIWTGR
jgi:hypothetical protein